MQLNNTLNIETGNYFITGTGTDVGKTHFIKSVCQSNSEFFAIKPIEYFFNDGDGDSYSISQCLKVMPQKLCHSSIQCYSQNILKSIYETGTHIEDLVDFVHHNLRIYNNVLTEGIGGIMSPIVQSKTNLDFAKLLGLPIILVCGSYIGCMTHILSSIEVLRSHSLNIMYIVINKHYQDIEINSIVHCIMKFGYDTEIIIM